jgi:hypothetical protein
MAVPRKEARQRGDSRGKRGVYLRIPHELYEKLRHLVARELEAGNGDATINGVVSGLIEKAPSPSRVRRAT